MGECMHTVYIIFQTVVL